MAMDIVVWFHNVYVWIVEFHTYNVRIYSSFKVLLGLAEFNPHASVLAGTKSCWEVWI